MVMSKVILFRVDSSFKIGTGHVMRCLTLAKILKEKGPKVRIIFICRDLAGNIIDRIVDSGFEVEILPSPDDSSNEKLSDQYLQWLGVDLELDAKEVCAALSNLNGNITIVIDHYAINERWEAIVRGRVNKIMAIDDLANRAHDCDILLDQNLCANYKTRYDNLTPTGCKKFLGLDYAILREQFFAIKPRERTELRNILIFFGGIDSQNITLKAINGVLAVQKEVSFRFNVVVIGAKNNFQDHIRSVCHENGFDYRSFENNMAEVMSWADISIGAGGTTSWERCKMKLPSILISLADNQVEICKYLDSAGVAKYIGPHNKLSSNSISSTIMESFNKFDFKALDCNNRLSELVEYILNGLHFADLPEAMIEKVRLWRNSDHVRGFMLDDEKISPSQQKNWFKSLKNNSSKKYLLVSYENTPIGMFYFTNIRSLNKRSGDLGFYIGEKNYLSRGLGAKMVELAVNYGRENLKLDHINSYIFSNNLKSIDLHHKLGFKKLESEESEISRNGEIYNIVLMRLDFEN